MTDEAGQLEVTQLSYPTERARIAGLMEGPVLHIGARSQVIDQKIKGRFTWRDALSDRNVIGADIEDGDNVDVVMDITWPLERILDALGEQPAFGSVICAHLLEHVRDPFAAARNVSALLRPGGLAFLQVPWVQAFHDFPDDYWRISFSGLQVLFPEFVTEEMLYSGGSSDVCYRIHRAGIPAIDREAQRLEAQIFQVLLPQAANQNMLKQHGRAAYLSRGYMPATVLTWLARKPG